MELPLSWFEKLPFAPFQRVVPVRGGDINLAFRLETATQTYFIKVQPHQPASYFAHEQAGLLALSQAVNVPQPLASGVLDDHAYLILNWLDQGAGDQFALGQAVARLHQITNDQFGFATDHTTKVLTKNNHWNADWGDFYRHQRLAPEVAAAKAQGVWNDWRDQHYQRMVAAFAHYYQIHPVQPSLLHGDLWAGNFLFTSNGTPTLIDPDALFGDREFDLAMTTIFGGFEPAFYQGYQSVWPLAPSFETRLPWYQFYYLAMHLILFGESYGPSVDQILQQY